MSTIWPSTYPIPERINLSLTTTVPVFETPENLFVNRRLMFEDSWTTVNIAIYFSSTEYPLFLTWLKDETGYGKTEILDFPFLDYDGVVRLHDCYMETDAYESEFKLNKWLVKFRVRVRELTVPSQNDLDTFIPV